MNSEIISNLHVTVRKLKYYGSEKMKSFKEALVTVLVLVLAIAVVGCGGGEKQSKKSANSAKPYEGQTIRVMVTNNPQYLAQQARSVEFTKKTGIKVEYQFVPYSDIPVKISTEGIAGSKNYDLVNYLDSWGPSIKQFLEPLDEYVKKDKLDLQRFPDAYIAQGTYDGKLYGLPVRSHPQMLFYRKDIFDKLDLQPPKTWSDVEEASKTIKDKTGLYGIAMYYGKGKEGQNLFNWFNFLWGNGSDIFDKKYKPIFNNDKGIEATQRYVDLLIKHKASPPGSVAFDEQAAMNSFAQGKSAMWLGWWWAYATFNNPESASNDVVNNVGFAEVPVWDGAKPIAPSISLPIGIMAASEHKGAAWEYIKWVTSPEVEKDIVIGTYKGTNPTDQYNIVVTNLENLKDPEINKYSNGMHEKGAKNLEYSRALPKVPEWLEIADVLSSAISKIAAGAPVQSTLDDAAKSVEKIMDKAGYYK